LGDSLFRCPRLRGQAAGPPGLWVDHDCCTLDGQPLRQQADWLAALDQRAGVRGAFALAHWDGQRLLLARDPVGERTLYYSLTGPGGLAYSSTVRELPFERRLDPLGLAYFLSCAYVPGRRSLLQGVHELLPGEVVEFAQGRLKSHRLWQPPGDTLEGDEDELRDLLRAHLEEAVRRRLPLEGEVGCTLSGGIDSSLVVALAAALRPSAPLHTYSLSFGEGYANELPYSTAVARHCRTHHTVVELTPVQVVERLDEVMGWLGKPNGDPLTIPNALLFQRASETVRVVLNGEGGDPSFGGPKNLPMLLGELYSSGGDPLEREANYLRSHLKCYDELREMLLPEWWEPLAERALETDLSPHLRAPGQSLLRKLMQLNLVFKGAHHILPKVETISYPFGVLPRSPLFDLEVVELALRLPPHLKLNGSVEKYLLKEAVRDLLPPVIVDRPKSGMMVPVEAWFSGPLLEEARSRLLDGLGNRGIFQRDYLNKLLEGKLGGLRPRRGVKIWLLITLECWLRSHWDQRPSAPLPASLEPARLNPRATGGARGG
jgi:asparagine synthase (glutamine-hydrolysing)